MFKNLTQSRQVAEAQRRGKGKIRLSFFVFLASPRPCVFALKSSYRHFRRERMVGNPGVPGTQGTLEIIFVSPGWFALNDRKFIGFERLFGSRRSHITRER